MAYNHQSEMSASASSRPYGDDVVSETSDKIGREYERGRASMEDIANEAKVRGRDAAENAQAVVGNFRSAVEKSTRDHPMTTLVMAVAMGFLVGTIWR